jgi:hypothetical protein
VVIFHRPTSSQVLTRLLNVAVPSYSKRRIGSDVRMTSVARYDVAIRIPGAVGIARKSFRILAIEIRG